jgi:hypothetical protein
MRKDVNVIKNQTEHIFNICEKPIMEYICHFLEDTANILFTDKIPVFSEPLIIKPIHEYDKHKFIIFKLQSFKNIDDINNNNRIDIINSLIQYKEIKEAVGFLLYAVKNVYAPIVSKTLINNKPMINNILELNEEKWIFYTKYLSDISIKHNFLIQTLNNIDEIKLNQRNDQTINLHDLNNEYKKVKELIKQNSDLMTDSNKQDEENINNEYKQKAGICILIDIVNSSELKKYLDDIQKK